jgi:hypothetical protein
MCRSFFKYRAQVILALVQQGVNRTTIQNTAGVRSQESGVSTSTTLSDRSQE